MDISRMMYLRGELEAEMIDLEELSEIEVAFSEIPDDELPEARENAMASDMLDVLETRVGPLERGIYEYVTDHYGESEANDPSWAIGPLAEYLGQTPVGVGAEEVKLDDILKGRL